VSAQIPRPLLDRTELITLSGYVPHEKLQIGLKYVLPRQLEARGGVQPVSGIKEKVVTAKRAGVKTVVLPKNNQPDVLEIPPQSVKRLKFIYVNDIDEARCKYRKKARSRTAKGRK